MARIIGLIGVQQRGKTAAIRHFFRHFVHLLVTMPWQQVAYQNRCPNQGASNTVTSPAISITKLEITPSVVPI